MTALVLKKRTPCIHKDSELKPITIRFDGLIYSFDSCKECHELLHTLDQVEIIWEQKNE